MTRMLVRRFLLDHARNRTTVVVLVLVPVAFVLVAAPTLADAARLLGGRGGGPAVEVATAGWAAAFVAGMAMYLQVTDSRQADRRLVLAGARSGQLAMARVLVGLVLAGVAAAAAFGALVSRVHVHQPLRVAAGTLLAAVAYLVVGAVVGTLVRVPVNGAVLILFIWIVDVFFGPNLSGTATPALRAMPLHYVSLWTTDVASGHAGRAGDLGLALGWAGGSLLVMALMIALGARPHRRRAVRSRPGSARDQLGAALRVGWLELRRNPVLWVLLALVPAVFVLLSDAITPSGATPVVVVEHGVRLTQVFDPAKIHAGTMAPIAVASLAALVGVFLSVDAGPADRRLVLAGLRPGALAGARGLVVAAAAVGVTAVTAAVTATVFDARQWPAYLLANAVLALTYAALGALAAPRLGRVTGVCVAFLGPFLDGGLAQSPMLRAEPSALAHLLPGYGAVRLVGDAGLTGSFDADADVWLAIAWVLALGAISAGALRHQVRSRARVNFITS